MKHVFLIFSVLGLFIWNSAARADESADKIVERANLAAYYAGNDGRSEVRMTIEDAQGRKRYRQFIILRTDVADGGDQKYFVWFMRPADVRGTTFLVHKHIDRDDDRWLYLPGLDLVKRIAAGDKRTSFVGSHYFYEDVSGRNPGEDAHEIVSSDKDSWLLKHTPKDPSSVEFAWYTTRIDRKTFLPTVIEYYDKQGKMYRRAENLQIEEIQGYPVATVARISDLRNGGQTTVEFRNIQFDLGIPDSVFSERSLRNPPRSWLTPGGGR